MPFRAPASGRPLLLLLLVCALPARAVAPIDFLIPRAASMKLAADPQWLRLGHWQKSLLGGEESLARGTEFFVAPNGARDPAAELSATLRALHGLVPLTPDQEKRNVISAQCR